MTMLCSMKRRMKTKMTTKAWDHGGGDRIRRLLSDINNYMNSLLTSIYIFKIEDVFQIVNSNAIRTYVSELTMSIITMQFVSDRIAA